MRNSRKFNVVFEVVVLFLFDKVIVALEAATAGAGWTTATRFGFRLVRNGLVSDWVDGTRDTKTNGDAALNCDDVIDGFRLRGTWFSLKIKEQQIYRLIVCYYRKIKFKKNYRCQFHEYLAQFGIRLNSLQYSDEYRILNSWQKTHYISYKKY